MKRIALIIALVLTVSLLASCTDATQKDSKETQNIQGSIDAAATTPETTPVVTAESTTTPATTASPKTTTAETTKSLEDIEAAKFEALKGATKALCSAFGVSANLSTLLNDTLIIWWEFYDFSDFKRVDKEFSNFVSDVKFTNDIDIYEHHLSALPNFETAIETYEIAGHDDIIELLNECIDTYKKLNGVYFEFSGTMKEYKDAFTVAYNNYADKCNACIDLFVEKGLIGKTDFEKISKLEQKASDNNGNDLLTTGQKNALKTAKSYLKYSAFSYSGLIDQLEYEGYSHEEAVYAVDNCDADWREQALLSAKSYLKYSSFSYSGLIGQLEYEQFSHNDAVYAVDNCGADWFEQAAITAESYLKYSSFSRSGLIDQLEFEGFTHEQAIYGVEQNGY